jgi:hypothetical protein
MAWRPAPAADDRRQIAQRLADRLGSLEQLLRRHPDRQLVGR